jgi:hypothetical protein
MRAAYPGLKAWAIICYRFRGKIPPFTSHLSPLTSSDRRHIELVSPGVCFHAFGRILIPALHDALVPRVKAHTFFPISVVATKQRTFPTAK